MGQRHRVFHPDGIAFPDVKIRESSAARDREEQIIRWIRYFFNPTTILQEGTGDEHRIE